MFRTRLRRLSVTDVPTSNNHATSDIEQSYDIKLEEITSQSTSMKSIGNDKSKRSLKRSYKLADLIIFALSNVVGSGIYVLAGTAGKYDAGPGLLVALVFGLISAGISALAYAQFASMFPIIGGYTYMYLTSGELLGFILAFSDMASLVGSASINAIGAGGYLRSFLESLSISTGDDSILFGSYFTDIISFNIIAPLIILIFSILVLMDIQISSTVMNMATTWNISLLCFFAISSLFMFNGDIIKNPCDYNNIYTEESCSDNTNNSWLPFGTIGIAAASPIAFWAFSGAEMVVLMAQESVNATKDIPRSIWITLAIVFILYEMVTLGIFGMIPYFSLDVNAPLAEAFAAHDETLLQQICSFGAFTTMSIILFATLLASPRELFRLSEDGLLPKYFEYIHPKTGAPFNASCVFCIISLLIAMFFDLSDVLEFSSVAAVMSYNFIVAATLILNYCPKSLDKLLSNIESSTHNGDIKLTSYWTDMMVFKFIWLFFFMTLLTAFIAVNYDFFNDNNVDILWMISIGLLGLILVVQCGVIIYLDKVLPWKDWIVLKDGKTLNDIMFVPFTPYTQCIIIMFNSYMVAATGMIYFVQWLGVVVLAVLVYVLYGFKHSNMNPMRKSLL